MTSKQKPLRLEWLTPEELADNPLNYRLHPTDQVSGIKGALSEVGWAGALLFNESTNRLIDGHLRKGLPAELMVDGKVPVLIGSWTEDQERLILASLDPLAAMAEVDKDMLAQLMDGLEADTEGLKGVLEGLAGEVLVEIEAYHDLDRQVDDLDGMEDAKIDIIVPAKHCEAVIEWLRNGEANTGPGRGKGVLVRCGLL